MRTVSEFSGKNLSLRGAWMTQSVKHLTLHFSSGHDGSQSPLRSSPTQGSALSVESPWDSLSLSSLSLPHSHTLSLKVNK